MRKDFTQRSQAYSITNILLYSSDADSGGILFLMLRILSQNYIGQTFRRLWVLKFL